MLKVKFIASIESDAFNFTDAANPNRYLTLLGNNQLTAAITPVALKGQQYQ